MTVRLPTPKTATNAISSHHKVPKAILMAKERGNNSCGNLTFVSLTTSTLSDNVGKEASIPVGDGVARPSTLKGKKGIKVKNAPKRS